jgi:alkylated DNA nucleotide flippase Atl1
VMAKHGHEVPWHRVLRASGEPYDGGLPLLVAEGVAVRGEKVVLSDCRWDGMSDASG